MAPGAEVPLLPHDVVEGPPVQRPAQDELLRALNGRSGRTPGGSGARFAAVQKEGGWSGSPGPDARHPEVPPRSRADSGMGELWSPEVTRPPPALSRSSQLSSEVGFASSAEGMIRLRMMRLSSGDSVYWRDLAIPSLGLGRGNSRPKRVVLPNPGLSVRS